MISATKRIRAAVFCDDRDPHCLTFEVDCS